MKRINVCILACLLSITILKAQSLDEVSPKLMVKIDPVSKGAKVTGLLHQLTDSTISILRPLDDARKSVRKGVIKSDAHFISYKFADMKSIQLKKRSSGKGAARGFFLGAMLGAPLFLDARAEDDNDEAIAKGVVGILLTGIGAVLGAITGATDLNFFKIFNSKKVGGSGIDEADIERMRELVSKHKY